MKRRGFYKKQAELFMDYFNDSPEGEILPAFNRWTCSNGIYGEERQEIWKIVRKNNSAKQKILKRGSEDFVRVSALLELMLELDQMRLDRLVGGTEKRQLDKT